MPQMILHGKELYPDLFEKAAVLMRELICGHVFEGANKRTGYMCAWTFLRINGYLLQSKEKEGDEFTTKIAEGKLKMSQIAKWLRSHSKNRKPRL